MELNDVKSLIDILKENNLNELKVKYKNEKLILRNSANGSKPVSKNVTEVKEKEVINETIKFIDVLSKNVGVFNLSNIHVGDKVSKGQKLAFIETMGIKADIKSPVDGTIKEIVLKDKDNVGYGEKVFVIE